MRAFHNDPKVKAFYLIRVRAHRAADEIRQGLGYWDGKMGCGVGCTIHGDNHGEYEHRLGIPRILGKLEDNIFEGLPFVRAMMWPEEFLEVIPVGADLSCVWPAFAVWVLETLLNEYKFFNDHDRMVITTLINAFRLEHLGRNSPALWREIDILLNRCTRAFSSSIVYDIAYSANHTNPFWNETGGVFRLMILHSRAFMEVSTAHMRIRQADKLLELLAAPQPLEILS